MFRGIDSAKLLGALFGSDKPAAEEKPTKEPTKEKEPEAQPSASTASKGDAEPTREEKRAKVNSFLESVGLGTSKFDNPEWIIDVYRLRVDDDATQGGEDFHGMYEAQINGYGAKESRMVICEDFAVFLKLALRQKVIPEGYDYAKTVRIAKDHLCYAFEKADVAEKWGGMSAMVLRTLAERTYGSIVSSFYDDGDCDPVIRAAGEKYLEEAGKALRALRRGNGGGKGGKGGKGAKGGKGGQTKFFDDIGGPECWAELLTKLRST
ncbi:hypothetical protein DIPPA_21451 [Diplonema papillatum]|nr:hypothetical protein DIPPA_17951 [Diplonema papillatum]KAJ9444469.1 hypothetical protein DIPPA_21451 [Diplonema papillatum]